MRFLFVAVTLLFSFSINAQVGIGTNSPNASAALHVNATGKGILIPTITEAQRNGISSPANGLLVYQTNNTSGFYYYTPSGWTRLVSGNNPIKVITGYISNTNNVGSGYTLTRLANQQYTVTWPAGTFPNFAMPDARTYGGQVAFSFWEANPDGSGTFTTVANAGATIWFTITEIR